MSSRGFEREAQQRQNRYLWIILPIAVAGMIGGILWGELRTPQYRSAALISVPNPANSMAQEALRVESPTVLEPATDILGFAPNITVDAKENAELLTVTAVANSAGEAALAATTVASTYVDTQLGSASRVMSEGNVPDAPFAPNRQASLFIGSGLGAVLGLMTALFMQRQVPNLEAKVAAEKAAETPRSMRPPVTQPEGVSLRTQDADGVGAPEPPPEDGGDDRAARVRARRAAAANTADGQDHGSNQSVDSVSDSFSDELAAVDPSPRTAIENIPGVGYPRYQPSALEVPPIDVDLTTTAPAVSAIPTHSSLAEPVASAPSSRSRWNDDPKLSAAASPDTVTQHRRPAKPGSPATPNKPVAEATPMPEPQAPAPQAAEPQPREPQAAEPQAPAPQAAESQTAEPPSPTPEPIAAPATPLPAPAAVIDTEPAASTHGVHEALTASTAAVAPHAPQLTNKAFELERERARLAREALQSRHNQEVTSLSDAHQREIGDLKRSFATQLVALRDEYEDANRASKASFTSRATLDQTRVTDLEEQISALQDERGELRGQLEKLRIDGEARLSDEQSRFDRSLDNARRDFRGELGRHNQSQRTTIEDLRQELDQALLAQREEHELQLAAQHDEYTASLDAERSKRDDALETAQQRLTTELKRQKDHEQQELQQQAESQRETIATLRQMVDQSSTEADEHNREAQRLRTHAKDAARSARHAAETAEKQIQDLRDELNAQIRVTQAERERSDGLLADLRRVNEEQSAEADRALAERSRHLGELRESVDRQRKYADDRVREISAAAEERAREATQREAELRAAISRLERAQAKTSST